MISINGVGRRVAATLVVATTAAIVAGPAVAASKDACAATRTEIIARLAPKVHVRVLAHEAVPVRTVLAVHRDNLAALDRRFGILEVEVETLDLDIEVPESDFETLGLDVDTLVLKRCETALHIEESRAGRHPLTVGIDILATLARLPGQAAIAAQHTLAALAKATPGLLRAVL